MKALWIPILGTMGTLSAAVLTAWIQRHLSTKAESRQAQRRAAARKAESVSDFAAHIVRFRRAELQTWHEMDDIRQRQTAIDFDDVPSAAEVRSARSDAWAALYNLRLLWGYVDFLQGAEDILHMTSALEHAATANDVKRQADVVRERLARFVDDARMYLRSDQG
jgi:hypothetical protein